MKISGVLLAAGKSHRMGKNKLLMPFGSHTVIEETLSNMIESGLKEVLVITGFQNEVVEDIIKRGFGESIRTVFNEKYDLGRAESIKCALRNISPESDAALFMVADKPTVRSDLIKRAIAFYNDKQPSILYVESPIGRGHPVIFSKAVYNDLLNLEGEPSGNEIFEKYRDDTVFINDPEPQIDVDTEEDYDRVIEEFKK